MSNSIWKTPDQEQEHNEEVLIEYMGVSGRPFYEFDDFVRRLPNLKRWCYITDLVAQADKAERLQKAVDNYEKVIVGAMFAPDVGDVTAGILEESHKTIKQLIKEGD